MRNYLFKIGNTEVGKTNPDRNINLDLIRCMAVFSVVTLHYFANSEFYDQLFKGERMYVLTIVRTFVMVCVPLFALLTGYLCNRRRLKAGWYKRITPILTTYLIASVLCIAYRQMVFDETVNLIDSIFMILNVNGGAIGYSWYINMYIGMFFLIPFLNVLYHGLDNKRQKQTLIIVFLLLTVAPTLFNSIEWFKPLLRWDPERGSATKRIIPDWWRGIWPITYYFIGAYLSEYEIKLSKRWNVILLGGCVIVFGSLNFLRSYGRTQLIIYEDSWNNYQNVVNGVLLFLLLLRLDLTKMSHWVKWGLQRISELSLGIYLCSYISDDYLYPKFLVAVPDPQMRCIWAPVIVLSSFFVAIILAQAVEGVQVFFKWIHKKYRNYAFYTDVKE